MFFYCIDNKKTPNGGMINAKDFYVLTDYSEQSIKKIETYLGSLFEYSDVTELFSQKQGNNSLLIVKFYLISYILKQIKDALCNKEVSIDIFQPENADIRDIHHILSHDAFTANDISWFQSIQLHLPKGDNSTHIFYVGRVLKEWIDTFNTTAPMVLTNEVTNFITNYIQNAQDDLKQKPIDQHTTTKETKTPDLQEIESLKKDIDQQKHHLNQQIKTINNSSSFFARVAHKTQTMFRKSNPKVQSDENEISTTNQLNTINENKHIKTPVHHFVNTQIPENNISTVQTELAESKSLEDKLNSKADIETKPTRSFESVQAYHPILQQLIVDKNIPKYSPNDESLILVSDYINNTENTLLREKIAEKNTSAMISLAVLKLEELQSNKDAFLIDGFEYSALTTPERLVLKSSLKLIESAANKSNAAAQYFIHSCYKEGYIYPKDDNKANTLLKESAKNGHKLAIKALSENLKSEFRHHALPTQNSRINDDIILWVVGAVAFVIGLLVFL